MSWSLDYPIVLPTLQPSSNVRVLAFVSQCTLSLCNYDSAIRFELESIRINTIILFSSNKN